MSSPDPQKNEATSNYCPNCKQNVKPVIQGFHGFFPDEPGKQPNPYSTNKPMYIERGGPLVTAPASSEEKVKMAQTPDKVKPPMARDKHVSEEFKQMRGNRYKKKNNDIIDIDEISNSCKDLAIDG